MKFPFLGQAMPVLAIVILAGCDRAAKAAKPKENPTSDGVSAATAPLDYLAAQGRAKQSAIKITSLAEVTQAIQKFHAMEDRYPRDLNELVQQHYLAAIPPSPNGAMLTYDSSTGVARFIRRTPGEIGTSPTPSAPSRPLPGIRKLPAGSPEQQVQP